MQKLKSLGVIALVVMGMASCCLCDAPLSQSEPSQQNLVQDSSPNQNSQESQSSSTKKPY